MAKKVRRYRVKPYVIIFCKVLALRTCVIFNSKLHIRVLKGSPPPEQK